MYTCALRVSYIQLLLAFCASNAPALLSHPAARALLPSCGDTRVTATGRGSGITFSLKIVSSSQSRRNNANLGRGIDCSSGCALIFICQIIHPVLGGVKER